MRCQYCNETEGIVLVKYDKNCKPAWMCKVCAEIFKTDMKTKTKKIGEKINVEARMDANEEREQMLNLVGQ